MVHGSINKIMKKLNRYNLDFESAFNYVKKNLGGVNELSSQFLKTLHVNSGVFFVLLPEDADVKRIHEFNSGYITSFLDKEICRYVVDKTIKKSYSYIFDDVSVNTSDNFKDDFSTNYSLFYRNEVYYVIKKGMLSEDIFYKCMNASNGIWHSLCLVTEADFDEKPEKKIDENKISEICLNTQLAMIGAYDGECYIFWEKT
jgi:hypothetical protein